MRKHSPGTVKKVLISFQVVNVPSVDTLSGILRYIRTTARWSIQHFFFPKVLTPELVHSALNDGFDGILVHNPIDRALSNVLFETPIPLVVIGNSDKRLRERRGPTTFIDADNVAIGRLGAQHILKLGRFRSYGYLPDIPHSRWSRQRMDGFKSALAERGIAVNVFASNQPEGNTAYSCDLEKWLGSLPLPAAVLLSGDYRASELYNACAGLRLRIPDDIAVLGVDNNLILCDALVPSLSSIEPAFGNEGFEAARALDLMMRNKARRLQKPRAVRIPPVRVVERESTDFLAPGTRLVDRAIDYIRNNALQPISTRNVADKLGVSTQLLALRFREYEHTTVREKIIEFRLNRVCSLLQGTKLRLFQIAAQCGFRSANYLTHAFISRFGISPTTWRKAHVRQNQKRVSSGR